MSARHAADVVTVVAAVIERDGAFLVTRRPEGVHLAGMWEFPGGKIDQGETHADALRREIREELGTDVRVRGLRFEITHEYPERSVALYFYGCELAGTPVPQLGQQMRWVPRAELATLDFPPADQQLILQLAREMP
jgi:mutator protein MutT